MLADAVAIIGTMVSSVQSRTWIHGVVLTACIYAQICRISCLGRSIARHIYTLKSYFFNLCNIILAFLYSFALISMRDGSCIMPAMCGMPTIRMDRCDLIFVLFIYLRDGL